MEQRYGTDPSRRYGTGVWNGGMERVWSRSLFRTSYFDLHPYVNMISSSNALKFVMFVFFYSELTASLQLMCQHLRIASSIETRMP